jgi:uncharacterized metal-binding protein YceD (DUF177 family)
MTCDITLPVDFFAAARDNQPCQFTLNDAFFEHLEQEEILGGDLIARISVRESAGGRFTARAHVEGSVRTRCDRCLEAVTFPIMADDSWVFSYAADEMEDEGDVIPLETTAPYDLAWNIYETIALALPLQRVHKDGDCDPDMLSRLCEDTTGMHEEEEEE